MVTKQKGHDMKFVRALAFKIIKKFLDDLTSGVMKEEDIEGMQRNPLDKTIKKIESFVCEECGRTFSTRQGVQIHTGKTHGINNMNINDIIGSNMIF